MSDKLIYADLSHRIIGAAMTVLNDLKPGLSEKIYEQAVAIELRHLGHEVDQQARFPVMYRGNLIGTFVPDLIVDGLVIVDTKVSVGFTDDHVSQMIGYLARTELNLALLINFKHVTLQWKRVVRRSGHQ